MFSIQNLVNSSGETQRLFASYPELLTIAHMQELTGLSGQTLRREVVEGRLPGVKIGRRIFVPKYRLIALLDGKPGEV